MKGTDDVPTAKHADQYIKLMVLQVIPPLRHSEQTLDYTAFFSPIFTAQWITEEAIGQCSAIGLFRETEISINWCVWNQRMETIESVVGVCRRCFDGLWRSSLGSIAAKQNQFKMQWPIVLVVTIFYCRCILPCSLLPGWVQSWLRSHKCCGSKRSTRLPSWLMHSS